jgi:hypothetical protein
VADIYQGKIGTISPAVKNYEIQTYINVDRGITGASGVTGANTLVAWKHEQGVTGIQAGNFTNLKSDHNL